MLLGAIPGEHASRLNAMINHPKFWPPSLLFLKIMQLLFVLCSRVFHREFWNLILFTYILKLLTSIQRRVPFPLQIVEQRVQLINVPLVDLADPLRGTGAAATATVGATALVLVLGRFVHLAAVLLLLFKSGPISSGKFRLELVSMQMFTVGGAQGGFVPASHQTRSNDRVKISREKIIRDTYRVGWEIKEKFN